MNGLLLDHFQWFMVILYDDMPAVQVCVELLEAEEHHQYLHQVFMSVRVLLAKVIGQPLCMRAVPKPYSLASICTMPG